MKKNNKILKLVCFFLLIFTFSININAETVKIYYADEDGYKKTSETEPDGYPNTEKSELVFLERLPVGEHEVVKWYMCTNDSGEHVYQEMSCMASNSKNPEYTHNSGSFYSCAQSANELIMEEISSLDGIEKKEPNDMCTEYNDEWTKTELCDLTNSEICKTEGGESDGYWYKEVENGIILDLSDNKELYRGLKYALTADDIKNAEINFVDYEYTIAFADISKITKLDLNIFSIEISDITELKYFTGLTELNLSNNKITDITPLSSLTTLKDLLLGGNKITDITPLSNLTNLNELSLWSNEITNVSALSNLTALTYLDLSYNLIKSIEPLLNLTNLQTLDLEANKILDLNLISNFIESNDGLNIYYRFNDFKRSNIIRNWNQFFDIINNGKVNWIVSLEDTTDSLIVNDRGIGDDKSYSAKFNKNNNLLTYSSGDAVAFLGFLELLFIIDYDHDDCNKYKLNTEDLGFAIDDVGRDGFTKEMFEKFKSMLGKFGDYIIFDATYDDNDMVESFKFVLDMNYFYNYDKTSNPPTGVANWLILFGVVLGSSAVGYVIINKHRRSVEL